LADDRLFDYPFLWLQQPAAGRWNPTSEDSQRLREYLLRGGFLMVDDFHGEYEWDYFESVMKRVFPEKDFVEVAQSDPLMHIFFDVDQNVQIPGDRHLRFGGPPAMQGPPCRRSAAGNERTNLFNVLKPAPTALRLVVTCPLSFVYR